MADVSATASTTRNPSADSGRVGRGGAAADTTHDQTAPSQAAPSDQTTPATGATRGDPAVILSSTLTQLQSGQRFAATIIGQLADGRLVLDSARGVFVVDLKTSLALGPLAVKTSVLLQVVNVGEDIEAAVVAMNGVHVHPPRPVLLTLADIHGSPAPTEAPAPAQPAPTEPVSIKTAVAEDPIPNRPGTAQPTAPAQVAKPASPQAMAKRAAEVSAKPTQVGQVLEVEPANVATGGTLMAGTKLKLTIVAVDESNKPAPAPATAEPAAASRLPTLTSVLRRVPTPAAPAQGPVAQLKVGTTVHASVVTRTAPAAAPRAAPGTAPTAESPPADGELLQTPFGVVRVTQGPKLPPGATVTVQISEVRTPQPTIPIRRPPFDEAGLAVADLTRDWSGLRQALKAAEFNPPPAMLGHVVAPALASSPPPTPAGSLLFLLAALRFGDVRSWLGQTVADQIQQSPAPAAMNQVGGEFSSAARAAHDGGGSEWRPLVLPMHDGSGIQPVAWFIRRPYDAPNDPTHGGSGEPSRGEHGARFVIELDHRRLGELQLDGLVHAKRFDLVVRSHQPLSQAIRQDIAGLFKKTLDGGGFEGEVMFQPGRDFPLSLRADMAHRAFEARPHPDRA